MDFYARTGSGNGSSGWDGQVREQDILQGPLIRVSYSVQPAQRTTHSLAGSVCLRILSPSFVHRPRRALAR